MIYFITVSVTRQVIFDIGTCLHKLNGISLAAYKIPCYTNIHNTSDRLRYSTWIYRMLNCWIVYENVELYNDVVSINQIHDFSWNWNINSLNRKTFINNVIVIWQELIIYIVQICKYAILIKTTFFVFFYCGTIKNIIS